MTRYHCVTFGQWSDGQAGPMTLRDAPPPQRVRPGMLRISRAIDAIFSHGPLAVPIWIPWPFLAAGFFLTELKVIEVHFRRETHAFSLSEMPAVIGLFFVPPEQYLLALLVGTGAALLITSRQSRLKTAFNLANDGLVAVAAIIIFRAIGRFVGPPG